jgi:hypothetical protein
MSENVKTQPTVNIIPPISPGIKNFDGMMVEQWLTLRMRQFAKSSRVAYTLLYRVRAPLCRSVWHNSGASIYREMEMYADISWTDRKVANKVFDAPIIFV